MMELGQRRAQGEPAASVYESEGKRKDGTLIDLEASVATSTVAGRTDDISVRTVEVYKTRALEKMEMKNRIDVVRSALRKGWLQDE